MKAPAKVNLCLRVLGLREDGYHSLWTIFDALHFGDDLDYEPGQGGPARLTVSHYDEGGGLAGTGPGAGLPLPPEQDNLVLKAARSFSAATGLDASGHFALSKRIPSGAGLGGGSSDAAAALRLLCEHHGLSSRAPVILDIAGALGADVPFFLHGGRAWAEGRGDQIHPIQGGPPLHYLLLFPGFPCPTGEVFAHVSDRESPVAASEARGGFTPVTSDLSSATGRSAFEIAAIEGKRRVDDSLDAFAAEAFLEHLDQGCDVGDWTIGFFNDLEPAAFEASPVLRTLRGLLDQEGLPRFCLSGSGSTLFVASLFEDRVRRLEGVLAEFLASPKLAGITQGSRLIRTRSLQ